MKNTSIIAAISGLLVAGSLALAGPASAHRGDAGDGSGASAGGSAHAATDGRIGIGIFTNPAMALRNAASTLGAWLHFRLARHAFGKVARRHPVAARWRQALSDPHRAFLALFLLRAFPLSNFTATNILAGALGMRGRVYLPATLLGMIPSTLFYACCGKLVRKPAMEYYLLLGVLFLAILLGTLLARRLLLPGNADKKAL